MLCEFVGGSCSVNECVDIKIQFQTLLVVSYTLAT